MKRINLVVFLMLSGVSLPAQNLKYNYDRHTAGLISRTTFYQPKSNNETNSFIYDKGGVSFLDVYGFYQWKKKTSYTVGVGLQNRLSEFKDSVLFQVRDKFIGVAFQIGKRQYLIDHLLFADYSLGTSIRKVITRNYLPEQTITGLPEDKSFDNSFTGAVLVEFKLNFEIIKSEGSLFVGLSAENDFYQFGNANFNRYTNKLRTVSLNFGFATFL